MSLLPCHAANILNSGLSILASSAKYARRPALTMQPVCGEGCLCPVTLHLQNLRSCMAAAVLQCSPPGCLWPGNLVKTVRLVIIPFIYCNKARAQPAPACLTSQPALLPCFRGMWDDQSWLQRVSLSASLAAMRPGCMWNQHV